ncbi:hypothetical protein BD309DRAFT_761408 [Dichomitus squalens]|nr:hypothetical protein BD309DRAFT_761408 [Dichomitus squalens]
MSLLQIDDALCHWLAGHNVILDFLGDREAWPPQVAGIAGLLAVGDGSHTDSASPEDEARRLEFVNTVCASAREWEKTRQGEQFPWAHILAGLMEEVIPDVTTYFDCEFVMPRPEASTAQVFGRQKSLFNLRGKASLLVLLEVDCMAAEERRTEEPAAVNGHLSDDGKNPALATLKTPVAQGKNECLTVQLEHAGSASNATLHDVEERDGSDFSKWVEIEDASALKRKAVYIADENITRPVDSKVIAAVDLKYRGILHFLTAPLEWCSIWSGSTSGSERRARPSDLYDDLCSSSDVELHLFPSPFHPRPLAPLLCVADESDLIPLMCSALHQRRALGLDASVVGILLPRTGSTCEVLFGWIEKELRPGRILPRVHICARGISSRILTVFDLERPYNAFCVVQFLASLGPHAEYLRAKTCRNGHGSQGGRAWRADTYLGSKFAASGKESDERIRLWAYEVACCNQVGEEEDGHAIVPRAVGSARKKTDAEQEVKQLRQSVAELFIAEMSKAPRRSRSPIATSDPRRVPRDQQLPVPSADTVEDLVRESRRDARKQSPDDSGSRVMSSCSSCCDGSDGPDTLWQRAYNVLTSW